MGDNMKDYKIRIRELREDNDLTQKQIADILKYTQSAYSKIERGERDLKIQDLITLCNFYRVSADYILGIRILNNEQ